MQLDGVITALITPFREGNIDEEGMRENVRVQLEHGVGALLVLGTTGEGSTLREEEKERIVRITLEEAKGEIPVIASIGENGTEQAVIKAKKAKEWGVDAALVITPYYNCPTQGGIIAHFEAIKEGSDLPLLLYHHPKRTGVSVTVETAFYLAEHGVIEGMKETSGDVNLAAKFLHVLPSDFLFFSGDDMLTLPLMSLGVKGVISVMSNLLPSEMVEMVGAALQGRFDVAREMYHVLFPLFQVAVMETNPIPIKALMEIAGRSSGKCRLPLTTLSKGQEKGLKALLEEGLLMGEARG